MIAIVLVSSISVVKADGSQFTYIGSSLTNIINPSNTSPNQPASNFQWVITVDMNGGGQSLAFGNIGNTSISAQGKTGTITAAYPLTIQAQTLPEQVFYIVNGNPSQIPISTFYSQVYYGTFNLAFYGVKNVTQAPPCPTANLNSEWDVQIPQDGFHALFYNGSVTGIRVCFYHNPIASEYGISQVATVTSSQMQLSAGGQQETLTISSNNNQSATSADGNVHVVWDGNLGTGVYPKDPSQYVAISNNNAGTWSLKNASSYSTYQTQYSLATSQLASSTKSANNDGTNNFPPPCSNSYIPANNSNNYLYEVGRCLANNVAGQYINQNNLSAENLLGSSVNIYGASSQPAYSQYQGQQAFLVGVPAQYSSSIQQLTLTVKGSFIGVLIPKGTPKILSASAPQFNSGTNGTIKVQVENIGSGEGTFYTSLTNCNGVSSIPSPKYSIAPGQTQEIDIPIFTSGANQTINQQCKVTVTDFNGGGSDSTQVNVVSKPANQCSPGSQTVQGSTICPCLNQSGVWKVGTGSECTTCKYGVVGNGSGGSTCASPPVTTINQQNKPTTTILNWKSIGHKDVVIVTASAYLNPDSNYQSTLVNYENLLSSEGLSYTYMDLNSDNVTSLLGFTPNINDWHSVKSAINKIEYETSPTYLIILGGLNVIPMPNISISTSFGEPNDTSIPTDDPYGSLYNNNLPSIVVARIPGATADVVANYLNNDIQRRQNQNNNLLIVGDGLNGSIENRFVRQDTNAFSLSTTGLSCASNQNCFYAPPYCLGLLCNSSSQFSSSISNTYGIQYYDCHGDAYDCSDYYVEYPIVSSSSVSLNGVPVSNLPQLNTNPIVSTSACYNGAIGDYSPYPQSSLGVTTLALQFLNKGAAAYIGNTKEGYGGWSPSELAFLYNGFKNGETLGKAFLSMKTSYLTRPSSSLEEGTAHELQLYGDPTISISG